MVERLFLAVPRGFLRFVIVVFPDHTHLLFLGPKQVSVKIGKECPFATVELAVKVIEIRWCKYF